MAAVHKPEAKSSTLRHANRYDGLTWCAARKDWSAKNDGVDVVGESSPAEADDLHAVTCVDCLRRIVTYGEQAERRLMTLMSAPSVA